MRNFFTSDTHFFHRNIIEYCSRPFVSIEQMNEAMITIWNKQVAKTDRVYHLGDLSFGGLAETYRVLAELNGEIYLINGNHDDLILSDEHIQTRFVGIAPYLEIKFNKQEVVLSHYPILQWRNAQRGAWHLYGHTHGNVVLEGAAMDVGIDAHPGFRLWEWTEIQSILSKRPILPYPDRVNYPKRVFSDNFDLISINGKPAPKR